MGKFYYEMHDCKVTCHFISKKRKYRRAYLYVIEIHKNEKWRSLYKTSAFWIREGLNSHIACNHN